MIHVLSEKFVSIRSIRWKWQSKERARAGGSGYEGVTAITPLILRDNLPSLLGLVGGRSA
jgi:hypothetical protein